MLVRICLPVSGLAICESGQYDVFSVNVHDKEFVHLGAKFLMLTRRELLLRSLIVGGGCLVTRYAHAAATAADSRIEVLLDEPRGVISPNIYGHFVEHLGGVVYDGLWVGEDSSVPNENGIRKTVIEHMRKIQAAVIRYPGGCFADSYDWKDGVGPVEKRPRRTNFWSGAESDQSPISHKYEPNIFGTSEFVRFCKLTGAQPYLAANLRSLPPEDFYRWVEYCNSPAGSTSLADLRAAAGFREPFGVKYWGVGNESWGCGGNFTPQEYAAEFRRFTTWVPGYGLGLAFIASGADGANWAWTRGFLEEIVRKGSASLKSIYGLAIHHYAWNLSRGRTSDWERGKGDALKFDAIDWYELLKEGDRMESLISGHWQILSEFDPAPSTRLVVDEWGPWYKPGSEVTAGNILEQMPTLRDAVFSGMTLDIFNRHPEKVAMANCAQLINCLNSLYLAYEDRFAITPVGHVFELYAPHQGGQALRTEISAPLVHYDRDGKPATFWSLNGSASLKDKRLFVTVCNANVSVPRETGISVRGGAVKSAAMSILTAADIHAHNTFDQPNAVVPRKQQIPIQGRELVITLPPASVTALTLDLS